MNIQGYDIYEYNVEKYLNLLSVEILTHTKICQVHASPGKR